MTSPDTPAALLPCPFCGSEDVFPSSVGSDRYLDREYFAVICGGCEASSVPTLEPEDPATAWNTRADVARLEAQVAALKGERDALHSAIGGLPFQMAHDTFKRAVAARATRGDG